MERKELFVCECEWSAHQLIFMYEKGIDPMDEEIYASVYLNTYMGFWKRLVHGVKYIFGFKSIYGEFDSVILNPDDHERLQAVATQLTELYNKRENRKLLVSVNKNEVRTKERESLS